ncbi:hypothetical protein P7C71_g1057, partial [Lecanoromycetidae sp. Uapishka_2]
MAKDKERSINPAAAQRKAEKQKALKKGKAAVAAQRTERFASRNPRKFETTISELQSLKEAQGGKLSARDQKQLEDTEKDLARVKKAREVLGDKAPTFSSGRGREDGSRGRGRGDSRGRGGYHGLGKRGREDEQDSESETDEEVRRIPWPRDTPPPISRQRRDDHTRHTHPHARSTNANSEPLGAERRLPERTDQEEEMVPDTSLPAKIVPTTKTTYESAPQVRDLRKEATQRFVPNAVKRKIDATKGRGGTLLEEEEVQKLEDEGYVNGARTKKTAVNDATEVLGGVDEDEREMQRKRLEEEEERFRKEMEMEMEMEVEEDEEVEVGPRGVQIEEVSDDDR